MPDQIELSAFKRVSPAVDRSDCLRLAVEPVSFLLSRKPGESLPQRVIRENEFLLSVEDRRVRPACVIEVFNPKRLKRYEQRANESRMRVPLETRIGEVGDLRLRTMELDD